MEYQFTRGIQRPNAARLSLALSSVLHDSLMTDTQGGIAKQGLPKEPHQSSSHLMVPTKTPHSVLSSGSVYSQESWNGPETWAFSKAPSSSRLASAAPMTPASHSAAFARPAKPTPPPDSRDSSSSNTTGTPSSARSAQSLLQSARASSTTSNSNHSFLSKPEVDESKKEKRTVFKGMYKRVSRSTKAFSKMFSRSPSSNPPSSGVAERSSLKSSLPFPNPSVNQMASGSSVSSFGLSPIRVRSRPPDHKRTKSSPDAKSPLSVDAQTRLQRSPSISSPLGIPPSPSLTKFINQSDRPRSVRGRDIPFPLNPSTVSLPLYHQRSRSASQSSDISATTQATTNNASQGQAHPPLPRMPSNTSLRSAVGQSQAPQGPVPCLPTPTSKSDSPGAAPVPLQRPRSRSVKEVTRPMVVHQSRTEPPLHQSRPGLPQNPKQHGEDINNPSVREASFIDNSPTNETIGRRIKTGTVVTHKVTFSPSMPSMRTAYLETSSTITEDVIRERSRTGVVRGNGASNPSATDKPRNLPVPAFVAISSTVVPSLPERGTRSRSENISSRDPSPTRPFPRPPTLGGPSVPHTTSRRVPPGEQETLPTKASRKNNPRNQPPIRSIPRSPSLPSLRLEPTGSPLPPTLRATSHHEELGGLLHVRSPSLEAFPTRTFLPPGGDKGRATRQPLPSGIAERLRTRARSSSRSDDRRPSTIATSSIAPPPLFVGNEKLPKLESIPSASTYGYSESSAHPSGPRLSTVSSLQTPPSPNTSRLLRARAAGRPCASNLKSPSMPDLRVATNLVPSSTSSRHRRPRTPPPPLPHAPSRLNVSVPNPEKLPPVSIKGRAPDASRDSDSLPLPTIPSRPKPNTGSKDNPHPQFKGTVGAFHARSNKEIASEGDWDFLDRPPRPPRTPSVHIPATPTLLKTIFSRKSTQSIRNSDVPPMPSLHVPSGNFRNKNIGVAL